ncbi:MAG: Mur ligase family protein [Candidatus Saccharibacteria bacterium]|nr:Mur ligase family protein [Candidatus Saccharibacteria bacterium]
MTSASFEKKIAHFVREFFANHPNVKLVAVTGSAGKTSAKTAIATVLSQRYAVAMHEAEPHSRLQTLLQIMGVRYPDAPEEKWGWLTRRRLLKAVKKRARAEHPEAQVIVQEFSPHDIGYHTWFQPILSPDIAVITSVTTGRMHVEHPVEAVAQEMITLANIAKFAIINRDDIDGRFAAFLTNPQMTTYGTSGVAEYFFDEHMFSLDEGYSGKMLSPEYADGFDVTLRLLGEHSVRPAVAAMTVAVKLGLDTQTIAAGLVQLRSLPGRLQLLHGADQTTLLDDSYSSSPLTAVSALQTLYSLESPQRIAVLGNMNGLRHQAAEGHAALGAQCSPQELDWVVTVGEMANHYLAPAARQNGCQVKECRNALEAGAFVRKQLQPGGIALFKGSSGGVWLEEAIKVNLRSLDDEKKLVRQSPQWLERKRQFFSHFSD